MGFLERIGWTEVIVGVALVAGIGGLTWPLLRTTTSKSKRAEVPLLVDTIRTAEITAEEAYGTYVPAAPAPRAPEAVGKTPVPWSPSAGLEELSLRPPTDHIYGSYTVELTDDGFIVRGVCDLDGDGVPAVYEATQDANAHRVTPEDVY